MFIKQNTLPTFSFVWPFATVPNNYYFKRAPDLTGYAPADLGTGVISFLQFITATSAVVKITLAGSETDTLGDLSILVTDAGGNADLVAVHQVVLDVPGATVSAVAGNVGGDVLGSLLGSLAVGERIAIANTLLDLPDAVELGLTVRNTLRCVFAVLDAASVLIPGGIKFANFGNTKFRVNVQLAGDGSRPLVTYDFS